MTDVPDFTGPICSACMYALRGLPAEGKCPECGAEYGPRVLVLKGEHIGGMWRKLPKEFDTFLTITSTVFVAAVLITAGHSPVLIMWGFWGVMQFLRLRGRWLGYRVRLDSTGYGSRAGIGAIKIRPWTKDDEITLTKKPRNTYTLVISSELHRALQLEFECDDAHAKRLRDRIAELSTHRVFLET